MLYEIIKEGKITRILFLVSPKAKDCIRGIEEINCDYSSTLRLWDFANGFNLSADELRIVSEHSKMTFKEKAKVAMLVPDEYSYSKARLYGVFRDDGIVSTRVFKKEEKAVRWLLKEMPPVCPTENKR